MPQEVRTHDAREHLALPWSRESEEVCLAASVRYEDGVDLVLEHCDPGDFYHRPHREVFGAVQAIVQRETPLDSSTIGEELRSRHIFREDAHSELIVNAFRRFDDCDVFVTPERAVWHARKVAATAVQRRLIEAGRDIEGAALDFTGPDVADLVGFAEERIYSAAELRGSSTEASWGDAAQEMLAAVEEAQATGQQPGIATGFEALDAKQVRFRPGTVNVVIGRPGMGKTSFVRAIIRRLAERGEVSLFASLEVPRKTLAFQAACEFTGIPIAQMESGQVTSEELSQIVDAVVDLARWPAVIDDGGGLSAAQIASRARRVRRKYGRLDLLVVDYLQLMSAGTRETKEYDRVTDVMRELKQVAKTLDVPVVALSQLNRKVEDRADKHPTMADVRGSGAIEEASDVILGLMRPIYYWRQPSKATEGEGRRWKEAQLEDGQKPHPERCDVGVLKNKYGPTGTVRLRFTEATTKFSDWDPSQF